MDDKSLWIITVNKLPSHYSIHMYQEDGQPAVFDERIKDTASLKRLLLSLRPRWAGRVVIDTHTAKWNFEPRVFGAGESEPRNVVAEAEPKNVVDWGMERLESGASVAFRIQNQNYDSISVIVDNWRLKNQS